MASCSCFGYGHLQPLHSDLLNVRSSTLVLLRQGAIAAGGGAKFKVGSLEFKPEITLHF